MRNGKLVALGALTVAGTFTTCRAFSIRIPSTTKTWQSSHQAQHAFSAAHARTRATGARRRGLPGAGAASTPSGLGMLVGEGGGGGTKPPVKDIFDALMAGDYLGVNAYVEAGGDCSVKDAIGDTPLMLAVESEMTLAVTKMATEGGADVNQGSETTGETPLQLAAYYGYTHLTRVLVTECGAEVDARNKKGDTALGLASYWGNADTVKYLLEAGANPDAANEAGERPGDRFDAIFVPQVGAAGASGGEGEGEGGGGGGGPREEIIDMLNEARAARKLASV